MHLHIQSTPPLTLFLDRQALRIGPLRLPLHRLERVYLEPAWGGSWLVVVTDGRRRRWLVEGQEAETRRLVDLATRLAARALPEEAPEALLELRDR